MSTSNSLAFPSASLESSIPAVQYKLSHEKRQSFLLYQDENFEAWRKKEEKFLGKFLMIHNFSLDSLEKWENADFFMNGEYDFSCRVVSDWKPLTDRISKKGIFLRNRIIRPLVDLRLKSIAFECRLQVRLIGDSSIFIISRNNGNVLTTSPVIRISKDTSLKGIYLMFGCIDVNSSKFEYKRQVQVPENLNKQPFEKNYRDIEICVTDNGDSRISLDIKSCGKYQPFERFHTSCDYFLPYFEKTKILIAGTGDSVFVNTFSVQQIERYDGKVAERSPYCCCLTF
jgi:hypothetical protein